MELNNNDDDDIASCLNELCVRVIGAASVANANRKIKQRYSLKETEQSQKKTQLFERFIFGIVD